MPAAAWWRRHPAPASLLATLAVGAVVGLAVLAGLVLSALGLAYLLDLMRSVSTLLRRDITPGTIPTESVSFQPAVGIHRLRALFLATLCLEISPMTVTARTTINGQPRKTLASQIDRLDGILDGLDAALAGAVQEAVEQAVKQAVQAVLTEVLTNRELQEQLQQAAQPAPPPEPPRGPKKMAYRLWQATTEGVRRTVQTVKQVGRGVGMALVAAGGVVAGVVYAARAKIASVASTVYHQGKALLHKAGTALTRLLPVFAFSGT